MKLDVNGASRDLDATTLAEALEALDLGDARVATAVNGSFVPASARATTQLSPGDSLEILAPMQGG